MRVSPGIGVGPFNLGLLLNEAIELLQTGTPQKPFKIMYNEGDPLSSTITVCVPDDGLQLRFDPLTQRLVLIDFFDLTKVQLSYASPRKRESVFAGPKVLATFLLVYDLFGPTYPGHYDFERKAYFLEYNGLSFLFPIPDEYTSRYIKGTDELPLELPDGTTPATTRLFVFSGSSVEKCQLVPVSACSVFTKYYFESVDIFLAGPLVISFGVRDVSISTRSHTQDVLNVLGEPAGILFKGAGAGLTGQDYFFNYMQYGMDLLFDAKTHTLKKAVLHSNYPGHPDFGTYAKCNYSVWLPVLDSSPNSDSQDGIARSRCLIDRRTRQKTGTGTATATAAGLVSYDMVGDTSSLKCFFKAVSADMQWKDVQEVCSRPQEDTSLAAARPMVKDSSSAAHPFGATRFYPLPHPSPGAVLEVMRNGHIAAITVFKPPKV